MVTWQGNVGTAQMSPDDMWRQAQAEYDARAAAPRNDAFGRILQADTPDALKEELFAPLQEYTQALVQRARPVAAERPFQFHADPFGELVQFNPNSGQAKVLRGGRAHMGEREKMDLNDLRNQRKVLLGKQYLLGADKQRLADLEEQINAFSQPQSDPFSQDFGQPGKLEVPSAVIGGSGQPNRMEWSSGLEPGTAFAGERNGENLFKPAPSSGTAEVTRKTKDGRTAVFDARTKKFLRYAQ